MNESARADFDDQALKPARFAVKRAPRRRMPPERAAARTTRTNASERRRTRRFVAALAFIVLSGAAAVGAPHAILFTGFAVDVLRADDALTFDRAVWNDPQTPWWSTCYRMRMGKTLDGSQLVIGRNHAEVEALLGPPDERRADGATRYMLGFEWLGTVDLELAWNPDGTCRTTRIVRH